MWLPSFSSSLEESLWVYVCFDFIKMSLVLPQTSQRNCCRFSFILDAELHLQMLLTLMSRPDAFAI